MAALARRQMRRRIVAIYFADMPKSDKKVSKPSKSTKKAPKSKSPKNEASRKTKPAKAKASAPTKVKKAADKSVAKSEGPSGKNGAGAISEKLAKLIGQTPQNVLKPGQSILDTPDGAERLRELVKLAKEQGYLTFDDLNEHLPESVSDPEEMEIVMNRLRGMEIDIIDASQVDSYKVGPKTDDQQQAQTKEEEEPEKPNEKLDILDDPVRMYLKQMGQVPLLTREQEVEISMRIEDAELNVQKYVNKFGFIPRAYSSWGKSSSTAASVSTA
jgi:RNA polymerase primary sigma factor